MFSELSGMPQPSPTPNAGRDVPSGLSGQRHAGWVVVCPAPSLRGAGHLGGPRSPIASAPVWSGRPAGAERLQCPLELTTQVPCAGRAYCPRDRQHPSLVAESAHWALRTVQVGCGVTGPAGSGWTRALSQVQAPCSGAQTERAAVTRCVLTADPREPSQSHDPWQPLFTSRPLTSR